MGEGPSLLKPFLGRRLRKDGSPKVWGLGGGGCGAEAAAAPAARARGLEWDGRGTDSADFDEPQGAHRHH